MFENQTKKEGEEVILKEITEKIDVHYKEGKKSLKWWSILIARASNNFSCFLVCFLMVQVMLSLWSLFIESSGSYSRCRMSNGVMPCVLGPTSSYFKFWVNILIKDELQNVVVFLMIFIWVNHDIHLGSSCMNEHMNFWAITKVWAFPHTSESYFLRFS